MSEKKFWTERFEAERGRLRNVALRMLGSHAEAEDAVQEAWLRLERAALALTEALTRIADREEPVPDTIWNEAARHFDEKTLAALVVEIAAINVWNRFNVATRQVAGEWNP